MALDTSAIQLSKIRDLANDDGTVSTLAVTRQLRQKYGINRGVPLSDAEKEDVRKARRNLLKKLSKQNKRDLSAHFKTIFADPDSSNMNASASVNYYLLQTAEKQIKDAGLKVQPFEQSTSTAIGAALSTPIFSTPSNPNVTPQTPQQTPQPGAMPTPGISPIGPEPAPVPDTDDELTEENSPGEEFEESISGPLESEPTSAATATPEGTLIVEQLQQSMAQSSELVEKAANAVDSSAKATSDLQKTVQDTTNALKALTEAQKKTDTASPALSQQVLAQIQADPALAKLVKDGLLKWDDLLGKNPEPGKKGHVAGVAVGDPVVLPEKLQKVIDNLQTAQTRENASLRGAIEVNRAARTTTGFRPSDTGYYPNAQVWMPIRAPPASLPGRR